MITATQKKAQENATVHQTIDELEDACELLEVVKSRGQG